MFNAPQGMSSSVNDTAAAPPWLSLPRLLQADTYISAVTSSRNASAATPLTPLSLSSAYMCVRMTMLPPPPLYSCLSGHDARGSNLQLLHNSSLDACRAACHAAPLCSIAVLYTNSTCVLRSRTYFNALEADGAAGYSAAVALACVHTRRIVYRVAPYDLAWQPYYKRAGADMANGELSRPARTLRYGTVIPAFFVYVVLCPLG